MNRQRYRVTVAPGSQHRRGEPELWHHDHPTVDDARAQVQRLAQIPAIAAGVEHTDLTTVAPDPVAETYTDTRLRAAGVIT